MSRIKQIEPKDWKEFLEGFSIRNNHRRARFQIFKGANTEEEREEAFFEDISLKTENAAIVITRIDRTEANAKKIHDTITNVIGIAVQYDTDDSEDALEITDKEGELVMLRFESRVDGVS